MRFEVFTLGKHFLQVHTSKGFTLFANAKLNPNGEVVSYTDTLVRRGGSWVIDCYKFLTLKEFPHNPIYCAVFGFDEEDNEVRVNATDIDVESISGVNGQLVDVGNISLPIGQSLPVNVYGGLGSTDIYVQKEEGSIITPLEGVVYDAKGFIRYAVLGQDNSIESYIHVNFNSFKVRVYNTRSSEIRESDIYSIRILPEGLEVQWSWTPGLILPWNFVATCHFMLITIKDGYLHRYIF